MAGCSTGTDFAADDCQLCIPFVVWDHARLRRASAQGDGRHASVVVRRGECLKRAEAWASVRLKVRREAMTKRGLWNLKGPLARTGKLKEKKPQLTLSKLQNQKLKLLDRNPRSSAQGLQVYLSFLCRCPEQQSLSPPLNPIMMNFKYSPSTGGVDMLFAADGESGPSCREEKATPHAEEGALNVVIDDE
ncbi:hypothetical protein Cgig2_006795 [Carnegiea gigantea]|uniref:Uncharacterized protein n=1 Tax=Carnegiea gigantea TaxID=171969 RepID=A0A9Q1JJN7_9CARY|nr:hypothetical protein Cgig2_006795 [Carnegiea gigantea]